MCAGIQKGFRQRIVPGVLEAGRSKGAGLLPRRLKLPQAEELKELRVDRFGRRPAFVDDVADVAEERHELRDSLGQPFRPLKKRDLGAAAGSVKERAVHGGEAVQEFLVLISNPQMRDPEGQTEGHAEVPLTTNGATW